MLKAIGFTDAQVLVLVLAESLLIAVLGGAIGLGLGWLVVVAGDPTGGALPIFFFPPARPHPRRRRSSSCSASSPARCPAIQAMRLNAVDALRRE